MRLLLAGGGTGGHLFPAVAVAQLLLEQDAAARVLFVGTRQGLEQRLLPKLDLPLATVDMAGVVGRDWRGKLELIPKLTRSLWQARKILRQFRPDLVVGVGGYASVPVLLAARLAGTPYLLHEQNALLGLSNRLLSRGARRICLSFPLPEAELPEAKVRVTGNPVRKELAKVPARIDPQGHLLVFGGSRGARALNQALVDLLPRLQRWSQPPVILHQCGEEDLSWVQQEYLNNGYAAARVVPFIDDMAAAYRDAALVLCRAGATTLAELTLCGRPAVLVPFPHAAGDHQTRNARALEETGAAVLLPQREMTSDRLEQLLEQMLGHPDQLQHMADRSRSLAVPGAAGRILDECREVLGLTTGEVA